MDTQITAKQCSKVKQKVSLMYSCKGTNFEISHVRNHTDTCPAILNNYWCLLWADRNGVLSTYLKPIHKMNYVKELETNSLKKWEASLHNRLLPVKCDWRDEASRCSSTCHNLSPPGLSMDFFLETRNLHATWSIKYQQMRKVCCPWKLNVTSFIAWIRALKIVYRG